MTLEELMNNMLAPLVLAAISGGIGVAIMVRGIKVEQVNTRDLIKSGFKQLHEDVAELKAGSRAMDDRLRKVEISQAFREGREGLMQQQDGEG